MTPVIIDSAPSRWIPVALLVLWLGVSALIFYAWAHRRKARGASTGFGPHIPPSTPTANPSTASESACASHGGICCGLHEICEKGLPKRTEDLYFDDEELDRFAGRHPDSYTTSEIEEFREVLITTIPAERPLWIRCLHRRGIHLPTPLHKTL